jgi:hypothetical protein
MRYPTTDKARAFARKDAVRFEVKNSAAEIEKLMLACLER